MAQTFLSLQSSTQTLNPDELVASQKAKNIAAEMQLRRTSALVQDGVIAKAKLDTVAAEAQTATQELRERENLIQDARAGAEAVTHAEEAILRDGERAKAEREAELAELNARLSALRTNLLQLHQERNVPAPFSGTVVYRHPTPALVPDGQVVLALAKGPGFMATVQVPTREAAMLESGQQLRMKLKHSLVNEEVSGRLRYVEPVAGRADRRDLLIECDLPPEQFVTFSSGSIPVTLRWRPPLYTDRVMQGGLVFSFIPMIAWLFTQIRKKITGGTESNVGEEKHNWTEGWSYLPEEEELHQLGIEFGEGIRKQSLSSAVFKQVERALSQHPAVTAHLVKTGVFKALSNSNSNHSETHTANPSKDDVDRVLARLGLSTEDFSTTAQ